ncbi:MAG: DUF2905 domain-containing protein [Anaerolineae bacterium]|nr:DUF2905 domain-containing protein [Anaerolineae bacterium]
MNPFADFGRWLVVIGLITAGVGALIWLFSRAVNIKDIPGTIRIEGSGYSCVFPLLASIVLSVLLTVVLNIITRLMNR